MPSPLAQCSKAVACQNTHSISVILGTGLSSAFLSSSQMWWCEPHFENQTSSCYFSHGGDSLFNLSKIWIINLQCLSSVLLVNTCVCWVCGFSFLMLVFLKFYLSFPFFSFLLCFLSSSSSFLRYLPITYFLSAPVWSREWAFYSEGALLHSRTEGSISSPLPSFRTNIHCFII